MIEERNTEPEIEHRHPADRLSPAISATTHELLSRITDAFIALDRDWHVRYLNEKAGEVLGRRSGEILGRNLWEVLPGSVGGAFYKAYHAAMASQMPADIVEYSPVLERWLENRIYPSHDGLTVLFSDVTEKRESELRQRATSNRLETVITNLQTGIVIFNQHHEIELVNNKFCALFGLTDEPADLIGSSLTHLLDSKQWLEDCAGFFSHLTELSASGKTVVRQDLPLKCAKVFEWDYVPIPAERTATGRPENLLKWRDVTERQASEAQRRKDDLMLRTQKAKLEKANVELKALATTDGLTGLKNQRTFYERLGDEFRRARRYQMPLSLIVLDVDDFKSFNDTFGHPAGNSVLRSVAKLLQRTTRETDIVCRYGGEEFTAILPHTRGEEALTMSERIRVEIERAPWEKRAITISAGVCTLTPDMVDAEALMSRADQAMYVSKYSGKNRSTNGSMQPVPRNLDLGL